jgi:hypothetical protein
MIYSKHIRVYSVRAIDARIPKSADEQYVTRERSKQAKPDIAITAYSGDYIYH